MIDIDIVKKYVPVNMDFDVDNIKGSVSVAAELVKEVVSPALYADFETNWGTLTGDSASLLKLMQEALVRLSFADYATQGQLEISDSGFHNVKAKDRGVAWQWQMHEVRDGLKFTGYKALEKCLEFLWSKANSTFPLWNASAEKDERLSLFINTSKEFQRYYNIHDNACVYWYIRPKIRQVMEQDIRPVLGTSLYNTLLTEIKGRNLTNVNKVLLDVANRAIAYGSILKSIPELTTLLTDAGIIERFTSDRATQQASNPARDTNMSLVQRNAEKEYIRAIQYLSDYLNENAIDYPLFEESKSYRNGEDRAKINNENRSIITFG